MNNFIKTLIISDFLLYFSYGLVTPIIAIFVSNQIAGATIETVGIATAIYWIVRSLTSIPLARWMDKHDGEKDEFHFMFWGALLMSLTLMSLAWATEIWQVYLIQALFGVFNSMAIPGWRILFTNHIDTGRTGFEWSVWDVAVASGTALAAYAGSVVAQVYGFHVLFIAVGVIGVLGALILIPMYEHTRTLAQLRHLHKKTGEELLEVASLDKP
ncbi:MAG TPA: MFS transporter [Candidatus Paceibacterota bacterium]